MTGSIVNTGLGCISYVGHVILIVLFYWCGEINVIWLEGDSVSPKNPRRRILNAIRILEFELLIKLPRKMSESLGG